LRLFRLGRVRQLGRAILWLLLALWGRLGQQGRVRLLLQRGRVLLLAPALQCFLLGLLARSGRDYL
jgi:hypothetical protein